MTPENKKDTREDWRFNINRANEIVRLYGNQTGYFVKITLSLITTYNILYVIFAILFDFMSFNPVAFLALTIAFIAYLFFAILTLILSLIGKTKIKEPSLCHYSYLYTKKKKILLIFKKIDIDEEKEKYIRNDLSPTEFEKDYRVQLINFLSL